MLEKAFGNFKFKYPEIAGVVVIEPKVFSDSRGHFLETFAAESFEAAGVPTSYKQDNESFSTKGVLRGLHMQSPTYQGKLVRVSEGSVFDVAVDLRKGSPTIGHWFGLVLSAKEKNMMYIPEGFAHGFLALENSRFVYKCTEGWRQGEDMTVGHDDPAFCIPWLRYATEYDIPEFILSAKDISSRISFEQYSYKYL